MNQFKIEEIQINKANYHISNLVCDFNFMLP
jgi:hypothetical protein